MSDRCPTCGGTEEDRRYVTYHGRLVHVRKPCTDKFHATKEVIALDPTDSTETVKPTDSRLHGG